jgi:cation diffusion facilitator CzcD-associated flavoprotein CzcO
MADIERVLIVGGGIAGLTLATALRWYGGNLIFVSSMYPALRASAFARKREEASQTSSTGTRPVRAAALSISKSFSVWLA